MTGRTLDNFSLRQARLAAGILELVDEIFTGIFSHA
jgi:hypothetical protein